MAGDHCPVHRGMDRGCVECHRAALETARRHELTPCDEIRLAQIPEYQAEVTRLRRERDDARELAEEWRDNHHTWFRYPWEPEGPDDGE